MKSVAKHIFTLLTLLVIAFALGGCGGVAVSEYGYTPVYGDYGYVGPWVSGPIVVAGGYFAAPPYGRPGGPPRNENHRPPKAGAGRNHNHAPAQRAAPHPIPSIPDHPRPAAPRGGGGNNQHKR